MKRRIAAALGVVALAASIGLASPAHAGPPPPSTPVTDISFEGGGHYMSACDVIGDVVRFETPTSCLDNHWIVTKRGTTGGVYYSVCTLANANLCMTVSTTQEGWVGIETYVGKANQWWWNPTGGYGEYHWTNVGADEYLLDPSGVNGAQATYTVYGSCPYSDNGCTLQETT